MNQTLYTVITMFAAGALWAGQGPQGPRAGSPLSLGALETVAGNVTAVNIGYGLAYPSIAVNQSQIKVAPAWYLLDQGFEIKVGDAVSVLAARPAVSSDAYLYALEIANTSSKQHIVLRNAYGIPLWTARGNSGTRKALGGVVDPATINTVSGIIETVNLGVGIQMPTLTVKTPEGRLITFKLGPERILLEADLELRPGEPVTVKYAFEPCTGQYLALAVTNASGVTLVLRNDDGSPAWH